MKTNEAVQKYLDALTDDKRDAMNALRKTIVKALPKGFEEGIQYGMIAYSVSMKLYPKGYHCDPSQPLPFLSIAAQKNSINIYHMGIYASPELLKWFTDEYAKTVKGKLDMGKSCMRFKKPELIPHTLIGELCKKMTPADWIACYESNFRK
jgi:hypothetical protein